MAGSTDTPLMRQYLEIKARYPDAILFFQLGDFYEMFFEDAVVASSALELILTSRDKNKEDPVPMCGVPQHAASGYVRKLLDQGFKVAICDQVEDPRVAKGIVRREVTQLVTPGVVLDTEHLEAKTNNFLVAIRVGEKKENGSSQRFGVAALDLSTCELRVTEMSESNETINELARLAPKEIIYPKEKEDSLGALKKQAGNLSIWHPGPATVFQDLAADKKYLGGHSSDPEVVRLLETMPLAIGAGAAALRYAEVTQSGRGVPACRLLVYEPADHLQLDETTLNNLEIFFSLMERKRWGSLIWVLDRTFTAMGGRMLRRMLAMPLSEVSAVQRRHDAVEFLVKRADLRRHLREILREIHDLERLTSRIVLEVATPKELARLGVSLERLPILAKLLQTTCEGASIDLRIQNEADILKAAGPVSVATSPAVLASLRSGGKGFGRATTRRDPFAKEKINNGEIPELLEWAEDVLTDVAAKIKRALVEDPPPISGEGGLFCKGFHSELDELIHLCEGGRSDILGIEGRERARTGIGSLKVRYNRVFGYYIEVTKSNLKNVPEDYQRKQTLANAERFVTPELAEYEAKVLEAQERRNALEQELFNQLRKEIAKEAFRLKIAAERVALLDVFCALAEVAQAHDYVRPEMDSSIVIDLVDARHPVVEQTMSKGEFVSNDVRLDGDGNRVLVLTGPNMSGKSTVMRQVCLITLMAQMGSFVPCRRARIGVVDRIFTRVGATDNLARGESTFMVEMRETAAILRNATSRSLVVLDEIGRGTATYDGISIAWAVGETLHDRVKARGMFATHYHELCLLAEVKEHVANFTIAVKEWQGKVVFLRKLVPGGSNRSYGIEVARLAGLDPRVVERAREVLHALEGGSEVEDVPLSQKRLSELTKAKMHGPVRGSEKPQEMREIEKELRFLDPNTLTPLEALQALASLVEKVKNGQN
ncbi:MAG: DNA mismatch repair protein MutS [Pseudomonadota bacterium]